METLVIWRVRVDLLEHRSPKAKGGGEKGKGGKGARTVTTCWNCGEDGHLSPQRPKKRILAVEDLTTASQVGSWDTTMVGAIESYFDIGSGSEGILEPRGAGEEICSVGVPSVREGEFVDIEIDSGAEVSCLPVSIGAATYPLHETRLSMCGGHHVAAGGGKLHELGARILGLEAGDVRGAAVNLLVRFRVMYIWQSTSVDARSQPLWLGDGLPWRCSPSQESFRHSHHARENKVCFVSESEAQASQRVVICGR